MAQPEWFSAARQYATLSIKECADALESSLLNASRADQGQEDPPRAALRSQAGELLVMPSTRTGQVGVKLVTVRDAATGSREPRIQGIHVQFDPRTLSPVAVFDGAALTNIRTAAVSVLALRALARPTSRELLVFGTGPQAEHHIAGICAEWPVERVRLAGRRLDGAVALAERLTLRFPGVALRPTLLSEMDDVVPEADIIVCATTSASPVFTATPQDQATVVAVGSHSPTAREVQGSLVARAYVAVEDRSTAMREAGDLILARAEGSLSAPIDADLSELVRGTRPPSERIRFFKSVGMAWEDAVVAARMISRP